MIIRDDSGATFALMECPHCENYEMHASMDDADGTFQCGQCFAMFKHTD